MLHRILYLVGIQLSLSFATANLTSVAAVAAGVDDAYIKPALTRAIQNNVLNTPVDWSNPNSGNQGTLMLFTAETEPKASKCFGYDETRYNTKEFASAEGTICINSLGTAWDMVKTTKVPYTKTMVREAQTHLTRLGYQIDRIDGVYVEGTRQALIAFQSKQGLLADGKMTPWIIEKLEKTAVRAPKIEQQPTPMKVGTSGEAHGVREPNPIVLTLDGVETKMLPLLNAIGGGFLAKTRADSYLKPKVDQHWDFVSRTEHVPWSGNFEDTVATVGNVKSLIVSLSEIAKRKQVPFVVVAHSWGTVLAYRSIFELIQEGKMAKGDIDLLVTMGSPLNAQDTRIVRSMARKYVDWQGAGRFDGYVRDWRNYWIEVDVISGPIPGLAEGNDTKLSTLTKDAHGDYWAKGDDPTVRELLHWNRIGADVKVSLLAHAINQDVTTSETSPTNSSPVIVAKSNAAALPDRVVNTEKTTSIAAIIHKEVGAMPGTDVTVFDVGGVRLFMTVDEVNRAISSNYPRAKLDYKLNEPCAQQRIEDLNSGRSVSVRKDCIAKLEYLVDLGGDASNPRRHRESIEIKMEFVEDLPDRPGESIVASVEYTQSFGVGPSGFDRFKSAAKQKYGLPDINMSSGGNSAYWGRLRIEERRGVPPRKLIFSNAPTLIHSGNPATKFIIKLTISPKFKKVASRMKGEFIGNRLKLTSTGPKF